MKYYLFVFLLNNLVFYELLVHLLKRIQSGKITKFLFLSQILLILQVVYYFKAKEENHYQFFEVNRVFEQKDLKKTYREMLIAYHPDKNKDIDAESQFIEIKDINTILSDRKLKELYDKFGDFDISNSNKSSETIENELLTINLLESLLVFLVFFAFGVILTFDENVRQARFWIVLICFAEFCFECFIYTAGDSINKDFFDTFLPKIALFERVEIIRVLISPISCVIRIKFRIFNKGILHEISEKLEEIGDVQVQIEKAIGERMQLNEGFVKEKLRDVKNISSFVEERIKKEIEGRETKERRIQFIKNACKVILLIFIALVISSAILKEN